MKIKSHKVTSAILIGCHLFSSSNVLANPLLQLRFGGGKWFASIDGDFGSSDTPITASEFGFDDEDANFFYASIEHGFSLLPFIALSKLDYTQSTSLAAPRDLTLDTVTFSADTAILAEIDLSYSQVSFYYPILDNWLRLDFGLTARNYDGLVRISIPEDTDAGAPADDTMEDIPDGADTMDEEMPDTMDGEGETDVSATQEQLDLSGTIPLARLNTQLNFPGSNWHLNFWTDYSRFSGNTFSEWDGSLGYLSNGQSIKYNIEIGYRKNTITTNDIDNFTADITIDGFYANLGIVF